MHILDRLCEYVFGNERRRIRFLCMYIVLFLACLACTLYSVYQAVSCFSDKMFWTHVMLTVWFGIPTVVSYAALQFFSKEFTRYNEKLWREHDQFKMESK